LLSDLASLIAIKVFGVLKSTAFSMSSLQMIFTRYYSWVKRDTRNAGSAFLKKMYAPEFDEPDNTKPSQKQVGKIIQFTSNLHQTRKKGLRQNSVNPVRTGGRIFNLDDTP